MTDLKDSLQIVEDIDHKSVISSLGNSQEDIHLERKLRELKSIQELRKDWILFILMDVVVFSAALLFIFAIGGYSLFILSRGSSSREEKKFATSMLTLIVTGLVVFVTSRSVPISKSTK